MIIVLSMASIEERLWPCQGQTRNLVESGPAAAAAVYTEFCPNMKAMVATTLHRCRGPGVLA